MHARPVALPRHTRRGHNGMFNMLSVTGHIERYPEANNLELLVVCDLGSSAFDFSPAPQAFLPGMDPLVRSARAPIFCGVWWSWPMQQQWQQKEDILRLRQQDALLLQVRGQCSWLHLAP